MNLEDTESREIMPDQERQTLYGMTCMRLAGGGGGSSHKYNDGLQGGDGGNGEVLVEGSGAPWYDEEGRSV